MSTSIKPLEPSNIVKELMRRWWILLLSMVFFSALAYYVTVNYVTPIYRASSTVFIGREGGNVNNLTVADVTLDQRLAVDYHLLITTNLVLEEAILRLPAHYRNVTIGRNLLINVIPESRFMFISFEDPIPERAALFVNTLSDVLKDKSFQIFGVEKMNIVDYARIPISPIRPSVLTNTVLAGFLGLLFAVMAVMLKLVYSNSIQKQEDVENELKLSVLGVIPAIKSHKNKNKKLIIETLFSSVPYLKECYRLFQANLNYLNIDGKIKVIMFSSAMPDEGKTSSISNSAYVLASSGKKVLLIDCDLRKGTVHNHFSINRVSGLTNCLAQEMDCVDSIKVCPTNSNLSILTTGVLPPSPADVVASNAFERFVNDIKEQYDFVFIDTPPVLPFADTTFIARVSDGIILVAAADKSRLTDFVQTKALLEKTGTRLLGVILTNAKLPINHKYYAYNDK